MVDFEEEGGRGAEFVDFFFRPGILLLSAYAENHELTRGAPARYPVIYFLKEVKLMTDYIQVFTTTDTKENARHISRTLLDRNLAACAQIVGPVTSLFWWENRINEEEEWLVIIKTKRNLYEELERSIRKVHKYEIPEILAIPVVSGSKSYLDWLDQEVKR
jgi:periplasmic divalent cation tolerance protein